MEKIDFLKKGITDFFPNFFITFSKVQRNIFNEKSHSNRKTNLKVDLVSCENVVHVKGSQGFESGKALPMNGNRKRKRGSGSGGSGTKSNRFQNPGYDKTKIYRFQQFGHT